MHKFLIRIFLIILKSKFITFFLFITNQIKFRLIKIIIYLNIFLTLLK